MGMRGGPGGSGRDRVLVGKRRLKRALMERQRQMETTTMNQTSIVMVES